MKKAAFILGVAWMFLYGCGPNVKNIRLTNAQLIQAAQSGNTNGVRQALEKGAEINAKPYAGGGSALFLACQNGHYDVVQHLLDHGANINAVTASNGATALYVASANGHARIVRLLLDKGASPYDALFNGWTPMTAGAYFGHAETARVLHMAGVGYDVHVHAALGRLDKVKEMVKSTADANLRGPNGLTPLFFAAHNGRTDVMRYLLDKGADPDYQNPDGFSPLHDAGKTRNIAVAEMLLEGGADIAIKDKNGLTPLHAAAACGDTGMVDFFLKKGADIDSVGSNGGTPLYLAVLNNQSAAVLLLIDRGADIQKSFKGWTPMHAAARTGDIDMAGMLLARGASVIAATGDTGERPVDIAYKSSRMDMVAYLEDAYGRARITKARQQAALGNATAARSEISRAVDYYIRKIQEQDKVIAADKAPVVLDDFKTSLAKQSNQTINQYAMKSGDAALMGITTVNQMSMNRTRMNRQVPEHVHKARAFKLVYEKLKSKYDRMASCLGNQGGGDRCLTTTSN